MRLYEPKVEVRLIKAFARRMIVPDVPVAARYGDLGAINLTPFLGEVGGIRTSKSVREPAGGFTITLADKAHPKKLDSLYALIEPMDLVEIRFCHDPFDYAKANEGYRPPVVMRGLVSSVSRSEAMSGGKPLRTVTIAGQDFGKILQVIQIFYLNNSVVGDNLLTEFAFFHKFSGSEPKHKKAAAFVGDVIDNVINPYLKRFTSLANGESVGAKVVNKWSKNITIDGVVSPYAVSSFNNVSLYQMLAALLDVGPFNEMYVEDLADGIQLTVRPAPLQDARGKVIQGTKQKAYQVSDKDIVSSSLTRTDAGVANYFWVTNPQWTMMSNEDAQAAASVGPEDSFILFQYLNSQSAFYGIRKMEVQSILLPNGYDNYEAQTKEQMPVQNDSLSSWIEKRRRVLADINKDNVIFEHGTIRLRGDERIKAGMQLTVSRGSGVLSTYYVTRVDHDFNPYGGFTTSVAVERGTSFIARSQSADPKYYPEMNAGGVS